MDKPLLVEVIAYAPTAFYHCTHCEVAWREMGASNRIHTEQLESSLPVDLAQEYLQISEWVRGLFRTYCDRLVVKVIDVTSIEGFVKSLRYGVRRYPAVIVAGGKKFGRGALETAHQEIERMLSNAQAPVEESV